MAEQFPPPPPPYPGYGGSFGAATQSQNWTTRFPGQPEGVVSTETLQQWAKQKFINGDTFVFDSQNNPVQVRRIPGVFSEKEYTTAVILSWVAGSFGVDRFYLGHIGLGVAKLLTLGGCGVWHLVDAILITMRNVNDSNGKPLA